MPNSTKTSEVKSLAPRRRNLIVVYKPHDRRLRINKNRKMTKEEYEELCSLVQYCENNKMSICSMVQAWCYFKLKSLLNKGTAFNVATCLVYAYSFRKNLRKQK